MSISYLTQPFQNTLQTEPIFGSNMKQNNAGGFTFVVDKWTQLLRFLILGSAGGTYYVSEKKLTKDNAKVVLDCLLEDGKRVVDLIVDVSNRGRAAKNAPAIFALAICSKLGSASVRNYAFSKVPVVCRIGTHLFEFAEAIQTFGGWGRQTQRAFSNWYLNQDEESLALQLVKYQQREGWSHRDICRLAKPKPERGSNKDHLLGWACNKYVPVESDGMIFAFEEAKRKSVSDVVGLIEKYKLPREAIPTEMLNHKAIWTALLNDMPITAMMRNLPKMTVEKVFEDKDNVDKVVTALTDPERIRRGRLHPLNILTALKTYSSGYGVKSSLSWIPCQRIVAALDEAFYLSFGSLEPTGKRWLLAIDVSGSMTGATIAGTHLDAATASIAMAMVTMATEPDTKVISFSAKTRQKYWEANNAGVQELAISPSKRLDDNLKVQQKASQTMTATDCSLPMIYALENNLPVDVFVVYTDSETYAGDIQPVEALQNYRRKMNIDAKLIVVGMTATEFTIADPNDKGMLDVVGFDTATPQIISAFAKGEF